MAIFSTSAVCGAAAFHFSNFSEPRTSAPGLVSAFWVRAEYKVKRIANRAFTNVVSAEQKRVAVERQISVLNASEVFDFYLQDAQRYLLVIWLAWLALFDSFIMLSTEMSFVKLAQRVADDQVVLDLPRVGPRGFHAPSLDVGTRNQKSISTGSLITSFHRASFS